MEAQAIPDSQEEREATLLKIGLVQLIMVALLAFSLVNRHHHLTFFLLTLLAFAYGARLWSRESTRPPATSPAAPYGYRPSPSAAPTRREISEKSRSPRPP